MIVIADSGATKTQWRLLAQGHPPVSFHTIGLNPFFVGPADIVAALRSAFPDPSKSGAVQRVFFYGAGCAGAERASVAAEGLSHFFPAALVEVHPDILGAARALFGHQPGLALILGTGTNLAYYNGKGVQHYTPSLGYVLGDEGSGAYLGKELVRRWLYHELPPALAEALGAFCGQSAAQILHNVYGQSHPGRYLASFVPFIAGRMGHPAMQGLVEEAFRALARHHLAKCPMFPSAPLGVVGSVGELFGQQLQRVVGGMGGAVTHSIRYPIEGLVAYHMGQSGAATP